MLPHNLSDLARFTAQALAKLFTELLFFSCEKLRGCPGSGRGLAPYFCAIKMRISRSFSPTCSRLRLRGQAPPGDAIEMARANSCPHGQQSRDTRRLGANPSPAQPAVEPDHARAPSDVSLQSDAPAPAGRHGPARPVISIHSALPAGTRRDAVAVEGRKALPIRVPPSNLAPVRLRFKRSIHITGSANGRVMFVKLRCRR